MFYRYQQEQVYRIEIGHQVDNAIWKYLLSTPDTINLPITEMDFIERKIKSVTQIPYNNDVFDIVMASETHCFSSPGGIVHNSGDWIDRMSAVSSAEPDSVVQVEKENGSWEIGKISDNRILSAVSTYYVRLIEYTAQLLAHKLNQVTTLPRFAEPLPIIVSGGTSLAKGFVGQIDKEIRKHELPFKIKEVRPASEPLRAVARGCLIAASM